MKRAWIVREALVPPRTARSSRPSNVTTLTVASTSSALCFRSRSRRRTPTDDHEHDPTINAIRARRRGPVAAVATAAGQRVADGATVTTSAARVRRLRTAIPNPEPSRSASNFGRGNTAAGLAASVLERHRDARRDVTCGSATLGRPTLPRLSTRTQVRRALHISARPRSRALASSKPAANCPSRSFGCRGAGRHAPRAPSAEHERDHARVGLPAETSSATARRSSRRVRTCRSRFAWCTVILPERC